MAPQRFTKLTHDRKRRGMWSGENAMPMVTVYFTAANREEALVLGRALVEERLAACVNLLGEITSIYRWEGVVHEAGEVAVLAKTRSELMERVIQRLRELHSFECPCVVSWDIAQGNPAYLDWIGQETQADAS